MLDSETSRCFLHLPLSSDLPKQFHGNFLYASIRCMLHDLYGECEPYQTLVFVLIPQGQYELKENMLIEGKDLLLVASGPHAERICDYLPAFLSQKLAGISFDPDGYSYPKES